ncbi:MAG: hypothetical protein ACNS60_09200 [Candidatus Cyclobacteriaceae bacterium M2_1C_046]
MKNVKFGFALLLTGLFGLSACEDEVSQPTVQFDFKTDNTQSSIPAGRVAANSLEFTSGVIRLTEIEFETETSNGDSVEVNFEQLVTIDFATGETTPDLNALTFPVGTFVEARVELELYDDEPNLPSIDIEGTFVDSQDQSHPIKFIFQSGETFEVEKAGTITFSEGTSAVAAVTFDPNAWFAGVTSAMLEAATKTDGVIVISETSNPEIFEIVADGLDLATEVEITM